MEDAFALKANFAATATTGCCPHVDINDPRCDSRLSLNRLDQAFGVCFGAYHTCPMYRTMTRELAEADLEAPPLPMISITAHGRHVALRPTGS